MTRKMAVGMVCGMVFFSTMNAVDIADGFKNSVVTTFFSQIVQWIVVKALVQVDEGSENDVAKLADLSTNGVLLSVALTPLLETSFYTLCRWWKGKSITKQYLLKKMVKSGAGSLGVMAAGKVGEYTPLSESQVRFNDLAIPVLCAAGGRAAADIIFNKKPSSKKQ